MNDQIKIKSVWMTSREYEGLAGAGGVKDVCRQLAEALAGDGGVSVKVVLPCYGFMDPEGLGFKRLELPGPFPQSRRRSFAVDMNYPDNERREVVSVWFQTINNVLIYLLDTDRFREKKDVYAYTAEEAKKTFWQKKGMGHYDYFAMNILLQKASLDLMIILLERPDIIHCQDGHSATLPVMMREIEGYRHYFRSTGALVTIHNAGRGYHQEVDDIVFAKMITGLPARVIKTSLLGKSFDPFLASAGYAVFNTVSENYARELRETGEDIRTGWLGHKLKERGVHLEGITNGINPDDFDPRRTAKSGLAFGFDPIKGKLAGKLKCKRAMIEKLISHIDSEKVRQYGFLEKKSWPLFTFIGRLTTQKGVDVMVECLSSLLEQDKEFQVLLLGSGTEDFEKILIDLTENPKGKGRVCFLQGYDPELAREVYAAGDFFLIPSLYEPCGLTDYIAQLHGNIPIVHYVGGLVKVVDNETGFTYNEHKSTALAEAMQRALRSYRTSPEQHKRMQKDAVQLILDNHTWEKVMDNYLDLYRKSVAMIS